MYTATASDRDWSGILLKKCPPAFGGIFFKRYSVKPVSKTSPTK